MSEQAFVVYASVVQAAAGSRAPFRSATSRMTSTPCAAAVAQVDTARVPRQPQQSDRHDLPPRRLRAVSRADPERRHRRRRRCVCGVRRGSRIPATRSSATSPIGCSSRCAPSRRSTASPACASATASAPAEVVAALERIRQPFNVNSLAQIAALAALDDDEHVERSRRTNREGMRVSRARVRAARSRLRAEPGELHPRARRRRRARSTRSSCAKV